MKKTLRTSVAVLLTLIMVLSTIGGITPRHVSAQDLTHESDFSTTVLEIISFALLDEDIAHQVVPIGTEECELDLPTALLATATTPAALTMTLSEPIASQTSYESSFIYVPVTWMAEPSFNPLVAGTYVFTAEPVDGFVLVEGCIPPRITVEIISIVALSTGTFNLWSGVGTGTGWSWNDPVLTIQDGANITLNGFNSESDTKSTKVLN